MHVFEDMMFLQEEYKWKAPIAYWLASESMLVCRRLREAHSKAGDMIAKANEIGSIAMEMGGLGLRAMAQLLMKDTIRGKEFLGRGRAIAEQADFLASV